MDILINNMSICISIKDIFRPDSSTESNNDQSSPVDRRGNSRNISSDARGIRNRNNQIHHPKESQSMDLLRPGSNNR